jgi:hypothetical protein
MVRHPLVTLSSERRVQYSVAPAPMVGGFHVHHHLLQGAGVVTPRAGGLLERRAPLIGMLAMLMLSHRRGSVVVLACVHRPHYSSRGVNRGL